MLLTKLLVDAALLALVVIALAFFVAGLLLFLKPGASTPQNVEPGGLRRLLEPLERPRRIESALYRHHRLTGALIVIGSVFFLWRMATAGLFSGSALDASLGPLVAMLVVGNAIAFVIGVIVFARPSWLKPAEAWSNQWVGWESGAMRQWMSEHPRLRGLLVMAVSAYCFLGFGSLLVERIWA